VNLGGSDIYLIPPDDAPRKLWSSRDDIVYALDFDSTGRLIAGTGNKGRIYAIYKNGDFSDLLRASASQVTSFAHAPGGGLYCSSSNLGKIMVMSSSLEPEGSFESDVEDARIFSRWGRVEVRGHGNFELYGRSGNVDNPDRNWSSWARIDLTKDARLDAPAARFVQWRAVLRPSNPSTQIDEVGVNYLSRNVSPVIDDIAVQVGARFQPQPHISAPDTVAVNFGPPPTTFQRIDNTPVATRDRSSVAVRWSAHDDNDDDLLYSVYYRGENERDWRLLKSGLTDKFFSFDSGLLPDGGYLIRMVASDSPSHTPEEALSDDRQSTLFDIDNTPPRIESLAARLEGQQLHVTFHATDDHSPIKRAEYSVDAGDWQYLEPVGEISDSKTENYDFNSLLGSAQAATAATADQPAAKNSRRKSASAPTGVSGEHVVVVRVYDRADNMATAKYVAR
jgi:hypothetical protein